MKLKVDANEFNKEVRPWDPSLWVLLSNSLTSELPQTQLSPGKPRVGKSYGNINNKQRARLTNDDELMKSLTEAADKTRHRRGPNHTP